jgi:hypothetical protein
MFCHTKPGKKAREVKYLVEKVTDHREKGLGEGEQNAVSC